MAVVWQDVFSVVVALAYAASAIGYAACFHSRYSRSGRIGSLALLCGLGTHTLLLGALAIAAGGIPFTSQVLPSLCAWLVVMVYLYVELTTGERLLGVLVMPIVAILHMLAVPYLVGMDSPPKVGFSGPWFQLHVLAFVLAYAALAISGVSAVLYVVLLSEIQSKHLGYFYERLPSLGALDGTNGQAATLGFVFLTVGAVASSVWAHVEHSGLSLWMDPAFVAIRVTWLIYAVQLFGRWALGWRGKRAAVLSIVGFVLVGFAFPVVGLLLTGRHPVG